MLHTAHQSNEEEGEQHPTQPFCLATLLQSKSINPSQVCLIEDNARRPSETLLSSVSSNMSLDDKEDQEQDEDDHEKDENAESEILPRTLGKCCGVVVMPKTLNHHNGKSMSTMMIIRVVMNHHTC